MNKKLILLILIAFALLFLALPKAGAVYNYRETYRPITCPEGTYLIDYLDGDKMQEPICKGEPTGCPYGDSIPVDSPKCVAPEEKDVVESTTPTPVKAQEKEVFYEK